MHAPETLTGCVVGPHDPGYRDASRDYNSRFPPFHPRYVVFCLGTEDVRNAILWARAYGAPLRARSGRHSYEAFSLVDDGVIVDVSPMDQVQVDATAGTARIGAGADLLRIYTKRWNKAKVTIPGGSCATVGIAGLTLGGGFGLISRLLGLTCDTLLELEIVLANGEVVRASPHRHADLFWASQGGGGGNFGVVTEFTFRVHSVNDVTIFFMIWPWSDLRAVVNAFQRWADPTTLDRRLTPILKLNSSQVGTVSVVGQFVGPLDELNMLIQPLVRAGHPTEIEARTIPFIDAVHYFAGTSEKPHRWTIHSHLPHEMFKNTSAYQYDLFPPEAIDTMIRFLGDTPGPAALVTLDTYGGAIADLADDATAFPHRRGVRSNLQYQTYWDHAEQAPAFIAWVEAFRVAMKPWTRGAYVNYIDADIRDWPEAYYNDNLGRLVRVKRRYDPDDVFDFPQGIGQVAFGRDELEGAHR